jgi:pilus assembly protein CpaB
MKRRIVLIGVAVVLALFGTFAVYGYANSADERAVAGGRAVHVVVATKLVAAGTSWKDAVASGTLSVQNVPASAAPSSSISGLDAGIASDAVAQSDIAPGQLVLRQAFGSATSQTGVLAIPKGKIAITVSLGADTDVAGYVGPRSQVIIFVTAPLKVLGKQEQDTSGDQLTVTRTVVPSAEVIATSQAAPTDVDGQTATQDNSTAAATTGSVLVTLALSQQDAERVINQQNVGHLTLGLLSATSRVSQDGGYVNAGKFHTAPIWVK